MSANHLINLGAGSVAIAISAGSSLVDAESLFRANMEQVVEFQFNFVVSDIIGLITATAVVINLLINIQRTRKKK